MKTKFLRVTMPDGSKWDVPASEIAGHRASYYTNREPNDDTFNREYDFVIGNNYELMDWAANNMNWSDVQSVAVRVTESPVKPVDYQEGWVNGPSEIVEKEA